MKYRFNKKHAIITGGGSGIGRSISKALANQGAVVYIIDINEEGIKKTKNEIILNNGKAEGYKCNISNAVEVNEVFNKIMESADSLDILVNNAGISHIGNVENTSEEDFNKVFNTNVKGVFFCSRAAIPMMKKQQNGVILNIASIVASIGVPDRFSYSMSKGAVIAMTKSIARDYVNFNIRCNCVSPGRVHTPFVDNFLTKNYPGREQEMFEELSQTQPIGRMASPEEIAGLVAYLCSDEASFITGNDYPIDGGFLSLKK